MLGKQKSLEFLRKRKALLRSLLIFAFFVVLFFSHPINRKWNYNIPSSSNKLLAQSEVDVGENGNANGPIYLILSVVWEGKNIRPYNIEMRKESFAVKQLVDLIDSPKFEELVNYVKQ